MSRHTLFVALLLGLAACAGEQTTAPPTPDVPVTPIEVAKPSPAQQAADLANQIRADAGNAEAILREAGMTRAEFDALLYDVAMDPAAARSYAEAIK